MDVVVTEGCRSEDVARVLADLPEWFGIEDSIRGYVRDAGVLPGYTARDDQEAVGVCLLRHHFPTSAEIELLAVPRAHHRRGIGRALLDRVEADLSRDGVTLLQVKTFGPSGDSPEYERTRAFYAALGYVPLEERSDIWAPGNPCLISVKALRGDG